jgi:hypothetical protein
MNQKLLICEKVDGKSDNTPIDVRLSDFNTFLKKNEGVTLVEVLVAAAVGAICLGVMMTAAVRMVEIGKWQSAYETATSYGEQALEFAMYVPYSNLTNTTPSATSISWVSNSQLYSTATATNLIATTKNGLPFTLTNVTHLATQSQLPLDDLGSYVVSRSVTVTDRSGLEPSSANLNYKLITVSNQWAFRGRDMPPIVLSVIRDQP